MQSTKSQKQSHGFLEILKFDNGGKINIKKIVQIVRDKCEGKLLSLKMF